MAAQWEHWTGAGDGVEMAGWLVAAGAVAFALAALFMGRRGSSAGGGESTEPAGRAAAAEIEAAQLRAQAEGVQAQLEAEKGEKAGLQEQLTQARAESEQKLTQQRVEAEQKLAAQRTEAEQKLAKARGKALRLTMAIRTEAEQKLAKARAEADERLAAQRKEAKRELEGARDELGEARERLAGLQQQVDDAKDLDDRLEALTAKTLEQGREQVIRKGTESVAAALKPFREEVGNFRKRFDQVITEAATERGALKEALGASRAEMTEFVRAVRGSPQQRGAWGERKLGQLLEALGLEEGIHFEAQASFRTDEDQRLLRPDAVVFLPGDRFLVIDAKTPLNLWWDYQDALDKTENEVSAQRRGELEAAFCAGVDGHLKRLGDQDYRSYKPGATFEICLMYIPIEAAWVHWMARGGDHDLGRDVAVVSASTLIPVLRLVEQLWKQEERNANALKIARRGQLFFDKLTGFLDSMEGVGKSLAQAQARFDKAKGQLREGPGNLISQAQELQGLGKFSSKKALPWAGDDEALDGGPDEDPDPEGSGAGP